MKHRGFSLLELAIVIGILGIVLVGLLRPLAARMELQAVKAERETLRRLEQVLIGYAMSYGQLPAPTIEGHFPFGAVGMTNVSGREYAYVVPNPQLLLPTAPGTSMPNDAALDLTDVQDAAPILLSVIINDEVAITREILPTIIGERLVAAGRLP